MTQLFVHLKNKKFVSTVQRKLVINLMASNLIIQKNSIEFDVNSAV